MSRTLAIIVPVHNELGNIVPFYERTHAVLGSLPAVSWQMVFVNDGSDHEDRPRHTVLVGSRQIKGDGG